MQDKQLSKEIKQQLREVFNKHWVPVTGNETIEEIRAIAKAYDEEANVIYNREFQNRFKTDGIYGYGRETVVNKKFYKKITNGAKLKKRLDKIEGILENEYGCNLTELYSDVITDYLEQGLTDEETIQRFCIRYGIEKF